MTSELMPLYIAAAAIGFFHTLFGPDHYLPFIVISRAREWSLVKTVLVTFLCGLGHILSSIVLGAIGIVLGLEVMKLEAFEAVRGNLAGWALIAFGLTYFVWGLHRSLKNRPHRHVHRHGGVPGHSHIHTHNDSHVHVHTEEGKKNITPWVLFTIFILGPCEPLIPILMYPAAQKSIAGVIGVAGIFGLVTLLTMIGIVVISAWGISFIPFSRLERYNHALAGATICLCGVAIQFLGW